MIPVTLQAEPSDFDLRVRRPGNSFLRSNPKPTPKQLRAKNYWSRCLPNLRNAYNKICAYSACWIPTQGSVDHFHPKTLRLDLAYEWNNYRLAFEKLNNYKGESTGVADPTSIQSGWFTLDFHSFYVIPGQGLRKEIHKLVNRTIEILHLNSDDSLVDLRFEMVKDYAKGNVNLQFLESKYPFIAIELKRQGLTEEIKQTFAD